MTPPKGLVSLSVSLSVCVYAPGMLKTPGKSTSPEWRKVEKEVEFQVAQLNELLTVEGEEERRRFYSRKLPPISCN